MLIIEIHVDTIEESKTSTHTKREDEGSKRSSPKRASRLSNTTGNPFWKAIKHRVPGYLIQYHKAEK